MIKNILCMFQSKSFHHKHSCRFEEKNKPGRFNVEKQKELGIPEEELWNNLQNGKEISINDKVIKPQEVLGEERPGKKIGISGDTMPTEELKDFFKDCDYLVFDSTFLEEEKQKALDTCHSTAKQTATLAKNANVKNLILTHFSARYKDETGHREEASQIHDSVITAKDLLEMRSNECLNQSEKITRSKKIVFVTGAGISPESGIPTFRGNGGLWRNYDAMKLTQLRLFMKIQNSMGVV